MRLEDTETVPDSEEVDETLLDDDAEIAKIEVPDAMKSWEQWKAAPSPATLSSTLKSIDPVIKSSINRHRGISPSLARGEAKRLAIGAIKTYDPSRGTSLQTHVFNHLRPLSRFAEKSTRVVSIPRDAKIEFASFMKTKQDFFEENGREPYDDEIRDMMGISSKKLSKLNQMGFYEMPEGGIEGALDVPEDESESRVNMWADFVYHDLAPRDRMIMDYRLGRNGRPVLEPAEIAARMNIDPSYVHRRTKEISTRILDSIQEHKDRK